jgi:hypothetical protein
MIPYPIIVAYSYCTYILLPIFSRLAYRIVSSHLFSRLLINLKRTLPHPQIPYIHHLDCCHNRNRSHTVTIVKFNSNQIKSALSNGNSNTPHDVRSCKHNGKWSVSQCEFIFCSSNLSHTLHCYALGLCAVFVLTTKENGSNEEICLVLN